MVVEVKADKDLSEDEAEQQLSYLAQIVDSRGWAMQWITRLTQPLLARWPAMHFGPTAKHQICWTSTELGAH